MSKFDDLLNATFQSLMTEEGGDFEADEGKDKVAANIHTQHKNKGIARKAAERVAGTADVEISDLKDDIDKSTKTNLVPYLKSQLDDLKKNTK
jgi:hypothetical protein